MTINRSHNEGRRRLIFAVVIAAAVLTLALLQVPSFPAWMGFNGKTLWDVLSLIVVPISLAGVTYLFNRLQSENERAVAQRQRELEQELADKQREIER